MVENAKENMADDEDSMDMATSGTVWPRLSPEAFPGHFRYNFERHCA